jgi:Predicted pyridoxal phosphate-dependent enzyme apparently involved in regulation of cell wall biogenesis
MGRDERVVPLVDLRAQYASIRQELDPEVLRVLGSGSYVQGEEGRLFEQEFAAYSGASHAVAVNSGTSALHLALLAAGIGPGDEVITVAHTFVATVAAILYAGAVPILVDIDPETYAIDVERIEAAITPRTRAIVPVHLYGQPADMDAILEIARRRGLTVIEDAAQAHGARYKDRPVGGIGDLTCFSFYPSKNLGAHGEGGAVTTNRDDYDRTLRMLRDWGCERKYHHLLRGYNYRLDEIQATILRVKLRHLDNWNQARRDHAAAYASALLNTDLVAPREMPWAFHVYYVYAVRSEARDELQRWLKARGVETGIHYPIPVHMQQAYSDLGYRRGDFPHSELAAEQVLSLPLYPELLPAQRQQAISAIHEFARASRAVADAAVEVAWQPS